LGILSATKAVENINNYFTYLVVSVTCDRGLGSHLVNTPMEMPVKNTPLSGR